MRGFKQEKMALDEKIIEDAIENLDGVIGWLTYFGRSLIAGLD